MYLFFCFLLNEITLILHFFFLSWCPLFGFHMIHYVKMSVYLCLLHQCTHCFFSHLLSSFFPEPTVFLLQYWLFWILLYSLCLGLSFRAFLNLIQSFLKCHLFFIFCPYLIRLHSWLTCGNKVDQNQNQWILMRMKINLLYCHFIIWMKKILVK